MFIMFQEADNWTTLGADMEEVFQSQDVEKVDSQNDREKIDSQTDRVRILKQVWVWLFEI